MNLFIRNIPHYHLLKYLQFLLKHPVYICVCVCVYIYIYIHTHTHTHTHIYKTLQNRPRCTVRTFNFYYFVGLGAPHGHECISGYYKFQIATYWVVVVIYTSTSL